MISLLKLCNRDFRRANRENFDLAAFILHSRARDLFGKPKSGKDVSEPRIPLVYFTSSSEAESFAAVQTPSFRYIGKHGIVLGFLHWIDKTWKEITQELQGFHSADLSHWESPHCVSESGPIKLQLYYRIALAFARDCEQLFTHPELFPQVTSKEMARAFCLLFPPCQYTLLQFAKKVAKHF